MLSSLSFMCFSVFKADPWVGAWWSSEDGPGSGGCRCSAAERRRRDEAPDPCQTQRPQGTLGRDHNLHYPLSQVQQRTYIIPCHRYSRGPTLSQVQQGVCLEWLKNLQIFYRTVSIREVFVFWMSPCWLHMLISLTVGYRALICL